jgi:hypothetical protein
MVVDVIRQLEAERTSTEVIERNSTLIADDERNSSDWHNYLYDRRSSANPVAATRHCTAMATGRY